MLSPSIKRTWEEPRNSDKWVGRYKHLFSFISVVTLFSTAVVEGVTRPLISLRMHKMKAFSICNHCQLLGSSLSNRWPCLRFLAVRPFVKKTRYVRNIRYVAIHIQWTFRNVLYWTDANLALHDTVTVWIKHTKKYNARHAFRRSVTSYLNRAIVIHNDIDIRTQFNNQAQL